MGSGSVPDSGPSGLYQRSPWALLVGLTVLALVACWFRQLHEERDPNVEPNPEKVETFAARGRAQLCL